MLAYTTVAAVQTFYCYFMHLMLFYVGLYGVTYKRVKIWNNRMNSVCPSDRTLCALFSYWLVTKHATARPLSPKLPRAQRVAGANGWDARGHVARSVFSLRFGSARGVPMNPRARGSSNIQWINRKDMSARTEDGVSLCQRALQIITELCLAGHVDREKCADIFPTESKIPGKGSSGKCD